MKEIRKNHTVNLFSQDDTRIEGIVADYEKDRVLIKINNESIESAKKLKELDLIFVNVYTHFGLKNMYSCVISKLDSDNCILIENNPAIPVEQKREFVRVTSDFEFNIKKNNQIYKCVCVNISSGGVAFICKDINLSINEIINITYPKSEFSKDIVCSAKIIKAQDNNYTAKHIEINHHDADKIMKRVFELLTR